MLAGIVEARAGRPERLAAALGTPGDLPQQWAWLTDLNRCTTTGGIAGYGQTAHNALRDALRGISTEQHKAARKPLAKLIGMRLESPVPRWLAGMSYQLQGNKVVAGLMMKRAAPLMAKVELPAQGGRADLVVDGKRHGPAPITAYLLPGAHVVSVTPDAAGLGLTLAPRQHYRVRPASP